MNKSFLDPALKFLLTTLSYLSVAFLIRKFILRMIRLRHPDLVVQPYEPRLWNEFYVVFALSISTINLWVITPSTLQSKDSHVMAIAIALILPIYRVAEILRTSTAIIFIDRERRFAPEEQDADAPNPEDIEHEEGAHYILVGNLNSWMIMILLKWIDIITCFAILTLFLGCDWDPKITCPIDAFYVSVVTMLTVGYGDFHPMGDMSKGLVIAQIFCFLSYVLLVLPIVASSFKTREIKQN